MEKIDINIPKLNIDKNVWPKIPWKNSTKRNSMYNIVIAVILAILIVIIIICYGYKRWIKYITRHTRNITIVDLDMVDREATAPPIIVPDVVVDKEPTAPPKPRDELSLTEDDTQSVENIYPRLGKETFYFKATKTATVSTNTGTDSM